MGAHQSKEKWLDQNVPLIFAVGIAFALISIAAVMYLYGLFLRSQNAETERKSVQSSISDLEALKNTQLEYLNGYGWADSDQGLVHVPIDRAMADTAKQLAYSQVESVRKQTSPVETSEAEEPAGLGLGPGESTNSEAPPTGEGQNPCQH